MRIVYIGFFSIVFFAVNAHAQYSPQSRTNSAEENASRLMQSLQYSDGYGAADQMQGNIKENYLSALSRMSMREMQDRSDGRIMRYQRRCRVCNRQATKCGIIFDILTDKNYSGQSVPVLVVMEPERSGSMKATEFYKPGRSVINWYGDQNQGCRK